MQLRPRLLLAIFILTAAAYCNDQGGSWWCFEGEIWSGIQMEKPHHFQVVEQLQPFNFDDKNYLKTLRDLGLS